MLLLLLLLLLMLLLLVLLPVQLLLLFLSLFSFHGGRCGCMSAEGPDEGASSFFGRRARFWARVYGFGLQVL